MSFGLISVDCILSARFFSIFEKLSLKTFAISREFLFLHTINTDIIYDRSPFIIFSNDCADGLPK